MEVELIVDAHALVGEGPWWGSASRTLYWLDIKGKRLHLFDPAARRDRVIDLDRMPGAVVGKRSGGLLIAAEGGFAFFDPLTGDFAPICDPEADMPGNRFNDGKCDSRGRMWAGSMDDAEKERTGSLYRLGPDLACERLFGGIGISNGLAFSPDDTRMYYIDTPTRRVDVFDFDAESGGISNRRSAFEVPTSLGLPDGMTVDREGMLWVALWGGWGLGRWDPRSGRLLERVRLPVARVSSCVFGGDSRDGSGFGRLYVTTASVGLSPAESREQPHAGGLFAIEPRVGGFASVPFAG